VKHEDFLPFNDFFNWIDSAFRSDDWFGFVDRSRDFPITTGMSIPANMKIKENRDIEIAVAVAGYPKDNIEIDADGDYLTVILRKVDKDKEEEKEKYICKGIKNSYVKQRFAVPNSKYDYGQIKADLKDGLLTITVPSKEEAKPKKVNINVS